MIQTSSSETLTAVPAIIDAATSKVPGSGICIDGEATLAVTAVAARIAVTSSPLRTDPSRRAAQQQNQNGVDDHEGDAEGHLPDDRRAAQRVGGSGDRCAERRRRHSGGD